MVKDGVTGILVSPSNPDEMASAIMKIFRNPQPWPDARTGFYVLLSSFFSAVSFESLASEYLRAEGVIHLDTNIGGGSLSPEEMLKKVKDAGLKVAIITDHDNMSVEYGLPPPPRCRGSAILLLGRFSNKERPYPQELA